MEKERLILKSAKGDTAGKGGQGACFGIAPTKASLERLYRRYNRPEFIHPDPLEFVHRYQGSPDREIAGIIAALLAYGRVRQILKSVSGVLETMGPSPVRFLAEESESAVRKTFREFKHRFTTGEELASLLVALQRVLGRYGSLEACFLHGMDDAGLHCGRGPRTFRSRTWRRRFPLRQHVSLPSPARGSACKRLNLFLLRWMARSDDVDPGVWKGLPASSLIVPLDTHMHRIALSMKLTHRKQADMRTALEITRAFQAIAPDDPVRYDFSLTPTGHPGRHGHLKKRCNMISPVGPLPGNCFGSLIHLDANPNRGGR